MDKTVKLTPNQLRALQGFGFFPKSATGEIYGPTYRYSRQLAKKGLLEEVGDHTFALTKAGRQYLNANKRGAQ